MPMPPDVDKRLTDLEVKASFNEDLVDELNRLAARQQAQIDAMVQALSRLHRLLPADEPGPARNLRDELPPHY